MMPAEETFQKRGLPPNHAIEAGRVVFATRLTSRLRGLLLSMPSDDSMLLLPCHDIHTFGMSYAIDVAFLDSRGTVLQARRDVLPNKRLRQPGAVAVLERRAIPRKGWFAAGDAVSLALFRGAGFSDQAATRPSSSKDGMPKEEKGDVR